MKKKFEFVCENEKLKDLWISAIGKQMIKQN